MKTVEHIQNNHDDNLTCDITLVVITSILTAGFCTCYIIHECAKSGRSLELKYKDAVFKSSPFIPVSTTPCVT